MVQKSMLWTAAAGSGDGAATYTEAETTRVDAGACPVDEARLLQIKPNSPILITHSTMYDQDDQALEHGIVHQRSDVAEVVINVIPH